MSTAAEILLSLHVLAAVIWVGGAFLLNILLSRALYAGDSELLGKLGREAGFIGQRLFSVTSLTLLVTGILLVNELGYDFGEFWIIFALLVLLASFLLGVTYLGPQGEKLGKLLVTEGMSDATRAQINKVNTAGRIELAFLLLVIIDMVVKPGL